MAETTYRASCHCGKFVYEITFPEPITKAVACNCSICSRKAYVFASPPDGTDIKVIKGSEDDLSSYTFGNRTYMHKFCGDCGSPLFVAPMDPTKKKGLNVRCFQGPVDVWKLEMTTFDGASFPPDYVPPEFTGTEPTGEPIGGGTPTIYHGSCHCGAVRLSLRSQPLDDTLDRDKLGDRVVECDCSICHRNGYRWFYPNADQVSIQDPDGNLKFYAFATYVQQKSFCGKCGVAITNNPIDISAEELAKLPDYTRTDKASMARERMRTRRPVNTRILHGVDLSKLPVKELNGYTGFDPQYVNP